MNWMEVVVLPLGSSGSPGRTWRACVAGLLMVLALSACGSRSSDSATADRQPASATTQPSACHPDEAMGRPCANAEQQAATEESEESGPGGQHRGDAYSGELYEQCRPFLDRSFAAYKACLRY